MFCLISASSNNSQSFSRNEYRLPATTSSPASLSRSNHRELPALPNETEARQEFNFVSREPPPSYWASYRNQSNKLDQQRPQRQRRPAPALPTRSQAYQTAIRSRVEQYRNRISVSDTESDDDRGRRSRILSPRRNLNGFKNEVLLGELCNFDCPKNDFQLSFSHNLDEDLFCPDLVRNCKSLPVVDDDQDYIEIEELTSQLNLHNEVGLPKVSETVNDQIMGQNVSLRRPKISLTWVLREQQNQSSEQQKKSIDWNGNNAEKIIYKKSSKPKEKLFSEKYVSENNLTDFRGTALNDDKDRQNQTDLSKIEKTKKFREKCCGQRQSPDSNYDRIDTLKVKSLSQANLSVKNTYSEPSIYITSAQSDSGALGKRYRRRRKRSPKFGYNIKNVDEFLSRCSLTNPANIPVVLSNSSILYQTRSGYHQVEIPLPLGMVVNSVFKNQTWLYVQTPHGEEGYVNFNACLPLGIIPNQR